MYVSIKNRNNKFNSKSSKTKIIKCYSWLHLQTVFFFPPTIPIYLVSAKHVCFFHSSLSIISSLTSISIVFCFCSQPFFSYVIIPLHSSTFMFITTTSLLEHSFRLSSSHVYTSSNDTFKIIPFVVVSTYQIALRLRLVLQNVF
jgi:hypothetical protein